MKYSTFVAAIPLLQLAVAQPHRRRHVHEHQLVEKDNVIVTVVSTTYAQATDAPQVIVYVDQNGTPVSTTTEGLHAPAQTPAAAPAPAPVVPAPAPPVEAPVEAPVVAESVPAPAPVAPEPVVSYPTVPEPVKTSSAPVAVPTYPSGGESSGFGLSYSPYNSDGTCKSLDQIQQDFKSIPNEYGLIRTYGTDCNQVANVLSIVKERKSKLFAGIFELANLPGQVATIVKAANGDWSSFHTISVGNELVDGGVAASTVVAAIGTVRGLLKEAGYTGYVVTVDTLVASRANPSLCDASDYCAVNCHPYFDGKVAAKDAGKFLTAQIPTLQEKLANKNQKIVVTETGWPWQGLPNGAAVATLSNQADAISSIKGAYASHPEDVILFTAFNTMWKKSSATQFEAEPYWGMGGTNSPSG
ncbi:related to glucanase [Rhynchosporium secalis]|uniref:Related to glucanase n=1 Tax=Rhynchosporium secalis TaxID=38038 RepID=A0A1E1MWL5_RHYSE|nr:related to glucanase [Rhynchosporium secalis]